jgi:DNA-binding XRE family transcriptional regulator
MKIRKNSGRVLAELRKIIGKSQSQFAAMIGVSIHTVISVENERNQLSRNLARRIEIATGANLIEGKIESPFQVTTYTPNDFERWRRKYNPSNETTALKQFDEMKTLLKIVFLAAAKSGLAGNRDRLPAVCLSFREWLNNTRQQFKLRNEIEDLMEDETRSVERVAFSIASLLEKPAKATEDLDRHDIDFNSIKKQLKAQAFRGWLIVEDEFRDVWTSSGNRFRVVCSTRKILPRAKCWIKTLPPLLSGQPDMGHLDKLMEDQWTQMQSLFEKSESQNLSTTPSKKPKHLTPEEAPNVYV